MATSGPNSPATSADSGSSWTNPNNILSSDNSYAITSHSGSTIFSTTIKATNFGFSIPVGATINGILVEIERKRSGDGRISDKDINIIKGGSLGTTNRAGSLWGSSESYFSYGSSSDLWGETWSYNDINSSDFGVGVRVALYTVNYKYTVQANIDHIRITVYYTESSIPNKIVRLNQSVNRASTY